MEHVNFPWKKLNTILNALIDTFNRQRIIQGDGISVSYTDSGVVISAIAQDDSEAADDSSSSSSSSSSG